MRKIKLTEDFVSEIPSIGTIPSNTMIKVYSKDGDNPGETISISSMGEEGELAVLKSNHILSPSDNRTVWKYILDKAKYNWLTLPENIRICYKFPSRSRPEKFLSRLKNIREMAKHNNYFVFATLDDDDESMKDVSLWNSVSDLGMAIITDWGTSKNKIDAVNRGMQKIDGMFDVLILMSDDMNFIRPGFDLEIIQDFRNIFPDGDGLLHYPDGFANERLITMPIMGDKYYRRFGYIYHPDYISLHCDNEQQEVARTLRRYAFINKRLFDHNHPAWGMSPSDDQYRRTESYYKIDEETFNKRKAINFGL